MNVQEGARRMKRAGVWLMTIPLAIVILTWVAALTVALVQHEPGFFADSVFVPIVVMIYLAMPGGALWLAGWIVEGFAKKGS